MAGCIAAPTIAMPIPAAFIHSIETSACRLRAASKRPNTVAVMPKFLTSLMPSTISTVTAASSRSAAE